MKYLRYFLILTVASLIVIGGCKESSKSKPATTENKSVDTLTNSDTTAIDTTKNNTTSVTKKADVGANRSLSLNFTLPTLDGKSFTLQNNKGKVIIMDFWATWCAPCRKEIPELIKLNDDFKKKGLLVVGVGLDNPAKLQNFRNEYKIDYTILKGTQQIAQEYGVKGIPTTYILDKKGRVIKRFVGYYPGLEKEIRSIVESAIKE
ncbi:MAG: redoxin domain-containing protein [Proteobacteria bacterium]|nr:redoxin domain-containing protein [Pseudomonadota bacterium]